MNNSIIEKTGKHLKTPSAIISGNSLWGACLLMLVFLAGPLFAAEPKTELLNKRMIKIKSVQGIIEKKLLLAIEMRKKLKGRMVDLGEEILEIQKDLKITSYEKATDSPRIKNNLMLLGQLHAYLSKLNSEIENLEIGLAKLTFLYQLAEDDLKIIETLNHMKVEGLLAEIDRTMAKYTSVYGDYLFESKNLLLPKPKKIWQNLVVKNEFR